MPSLPRPVREYVNQHVTAQLHTAYLGISKEGQVAQRGGDLKHYGLSDIQVDHMATSQAAFLEGLLPLTGENLVLDQIEMTSGTTADVHLVRDRSLDWIILLDSTDEARCRQIMQQRGNDLSLLRQVHARILEQVLGRSGASEIEAGPVAIKEESERRVVSILIAGVRGVTELAERASPSEVFDIFNSYLRTMMSSVLCTAGIVERPFSNGLVALFGLLPSTDPSEALALRAAQRMMTEGNRLTRSLQADHRPAQEISIGIATGPVVLGVLGTRERGSYTAIGYHSSLAVELQRQADSREILVDSRTRAGVTDSTVEFMTRSLQIPILGGELDAHSVIRRHE